ncbi:flavodoxin domain-containing protein [Neobacillus bataviensis]|uniref:flavodoxin domain-containing protein n=1 Tax=Neobacillus bataviensis TaxID=220685 RepID=UPI001CBAB1DA|nr:flavodoxin domain-containing protein [Neobacillus bataviensis]
MKIAIIYTSKTGNTEELIYLMKEIFQLKKVELFLFRIDQFHLLDLIKFDGIVVGTYTWGMGEIPPEMMDLYHSFEAMDVKRVVTGIVGTGDSGYPNFCGAVEQFKNMLFVHTNLAVTMKVELTPQTNDVERCERFVNIFLEVLNYQNNH